MTTTTTKVHLKKPEIVDGSYLEQSHVTKPQLDSKATTSPPSETTTSQPIVSFSSEPLKICLTKLNRTCSVQLENCRKQRVSIDLTNLTLSAEASIENRTSDSCQFVYKYPHGVFYTQNETISSSCEEWLKLDPTFDGSEILSKNSANLGFLGRNCLQQNNTDLNDLLEPKKQFNTSCYIDAKPLNKTSLVFQVLFFK